ncbi:MAG: glycosyltransferase family 39 protein, partial [Bacteroidales bacterium]|nr:glycosyltransferase family 39 protein [Bacteroidales bacterium]
IKLSNQTILIIIIIIGALLRLYNYNIAPFTLDEFSALFRTNFGSFSELIDKGVKVDGHPAGIQVLLFYWVKLFGYAEWVVKLPFLIFGILSIYLIYLIAKDWFNETVGLISAAFIASLQFPIMYSQIARPYISGLFFSLAMVYFWTKIMKYPSRNFYKNSFLFIVFTSLCAYNHHFSFLFAGIVGVSGLFLIDKKYVVKYIACGVLVFLLYIPHISVFMYQLNIGGVEEWLGKPKKEFFVDYVYYIFNFSIYVLVVTFGISIWGIFKNNIQKNDFKKYIVFSVFFLLPIIIGYFYSIHFSSVLQFSVLIFSFPFILFLLFGHLKNQTVSINLVLVGLILMVNISTLIFERQHYKMFYNSIYERIFVDSKDLQKENQTVFLIDSDEKICSYYFKKLGIDSNYVQLNTFKDESQLVEFLKSNVNHKKYLFYGYVSSSKPHYFPILNDFYPTVEWQNNYVGGTTYLLSDKKNTNESVISLLNFDDDKIEYWNNVNPEFVTDSVSYSSKNSFFIRTDNEWGPTYKVMLDEICQNKKDFIDISVRVKSAENIKEAQLVSQLESNGVVIDWRSSTFDMFYNPQDTLHNWYTVYHSIKLSDIYLNHKNIELMILVWNVNKESFYIDDFKIKLRKGNDIIYGLTQKI